MNSMIIEWVFARLKEPSTWAGMTGLITSLGIALSPSQTAALTQLGIALASVILVFMPEPGNKK